MDKQTDNEMKSITGVGLIYEILMDANFNPHANKDANGEIVSLNVTLDERFMWVLKDIMDVYMELSKPT